MFGLVLTVAWVCLLGYGLTELVRLALTDPKVPPTPSSKRFTTTMLDNAQVYTLQTEE